MSQLWILELAQEVLDHPQKAEPCAGKREREVEKVEGVEREVEEVERKQLWHLRWEKSSLWLLEPIIEETYKSIRKVQCNSWWE